METKIKIRNEAEQCVIDIEGIIGVQEESQFGDDSSRVATYERFRSMVESLHEVRASEVVVNIRSCGGDVNDAFLIYEALVALDAKVTTRCYGYTASAATIIAQAAGEGCRQISSSALYLIHRSSCSVEGNTADLAEHINLLQKTDERIAELYANRSGGSAEKFAEIMGENGGHGRWLAPEEVVALGLADEVVGGDVASRRSVVDVVKGWFSSKEENSAPKDINILHAPAKPSVSTSMIRLEEGQCRVSATKVAEREDPTLDEPTISRNAMAYAQDARQFRSLLR